MPPKKKGQSEDSSSEATTPAKKQKLSSDAETQNTVAVTVSSPQALRPPKPKIPSASNTSDDVSSDVAKLVAWVDHEIRVALRTAAVWFASFADVEPHTHQPLAIATDAANCSGVKDNLTSYKAPWNTESATGSLRGTKMYEAGGSILWCTPLPAETLAETRGALGDDAMTWKDVHDIREQHFVTKKQRLTNSRAQCRGSYFP